MIQAATRGGFTQEGVLRRSAWANGGIRRRSLSWAARGRVERGGRPRKGVVQPRTQPSCTSQVRLGLCKVACRRLSTCGRQRDRRLPGVGVRIPTVPPSCTNRRTHIRQIWSTAGWGRVRSSSSPSSSPSPPETHAARTERGGRGGYPQTAPNIASCRVRDRRVTARRGRPPRQNARSIGRRRVWPQHCEDPSVAVSLVGDQLRARFATVSAAPSVVPNTRWALRSFHSVALSYSLIGR